MTLQLGFVVNDVATERAVYTTTRLAMAAANRGHTVWVMGVGDFAHDPDGKVAAHARGSADRRYRSLEAFLDDVQGDSGRAERICVDELDVLMLRNDPADDLADRAWAMTSGILFGQLASVRGVLVVNDPGHLADAINKTYFQHFPDWVRPRTLISRDDDEIKDFVDECAGKAVLKPLQGSGGQGVFLVRDDEAPNINQIIETLSRDGYVVAQEYLEAAEQGDVRLFVLNGRPLEHDGVYAAFRRVNKSKDVRSNMHAGGTAEPVKVTTEMLDLVEAVRPKLLADGMFFVGLDIVGDKLMEVNVFSPGGLGSVRQLYDIDFTSQVIDALEHKVTLRDFYGATLENATLAVM